MARYHDRGYRVYEWNADDADHMLRTGIYADLLRDHPRCVASASSVF